jgi:hypothetical protein
MTPGQAILRKIKGTITLAVCDEPGAVPMGHVDFAGHGLLHQIEMHDGVTVAVVELVLRLIAPGVERTYRAYVDELQEGVMESLATAQEIMVVLTSPKGESFASSAMSNSFKQSANETLGVISALAAKPWNGAHFAVAKAFVMGQSHKPSV